MSSKIFLVALLVSAVSAGPAGKRYSECSLKCERSEKFVYEIGQQYKYAYEAETATILSAANNDYDEGAKVRVSAAATIQPITDCDYVLSLSDVQLHDASNSELFESEVTKRPLRFALQNGRIEHVCGSTHDPSWAANFKKGILSHLQNSMNSLKEDEVLTETDISGSCETSYSSAQNEGEIIIKRSKIPSSCDKSTNIQQKLSTFGHHADSLVQGLQLLKSSQECSQSIVEGTINSVYCTELHAFQPFENDKSAAKTRIVSTLKLKSVSTSYGTYLDSFDARSDLQFDYSESEEKKELPVENTQNLLSNLDLLTEDGVKREVPALFSELVASLRHLTQSQIISLYEHGEGRVLNFIVDALPLVNTEASLRSYVHLISKEKISEQKMDVWFTSLSLIKNPSHEMISAVTPLIEDSAANKAFLGISSMIHNYCLRDLECEKKAEIQLALRRIESHLGTGCRASTEAEKQNILYALKALGNAGRFLNAESVLLRCYMEDNAMNVRISAIEAWRRVSCSYNREHFLDTFIDQNQDNEIRIAAYLALMKCPTQQLIDTLKDRLTSESVNQVASFVWTHLTNLQESAAQEKQWIRDLIGEELLQKKFASDALKLSKNYESSFYLKEQKLGASVDSNVVFSGKSFLPRSSMLNFTIDLFGESINLFEFGARIEGFEAYIEQFFGPNGYYPEETVAAVINGLRQQSKGEETKLESFLADNSDNPEGSIYMKLLGNEIFYNNFNGIEKIIPEFGFSNAFEMLMELVRKQNLDVVKSYSLINSEFTFPTLMGFPIKLQLNGTATVGMKLNGQFNFEDIGTLNIKGKLHPSVAVRLDSLMSVDSFVSKSGIKMISTLHSSSALEGKLIINKGKLVDVELKMPQKKVELFEMTNAYFTLENNVKKEELVPSETVKQCRPLFCNSLGIEICVEKHMPNKIWGHQSLFTSPYKTTIFLDKTDTNTAYIFRYINEPSNKIIMFDMEGSELDKRWSVSFTNEQNTYVLDLHSPHGSANGMLSYEFNENKLMASTRVTVNDLKTYEARFNFEKHFHNSIKNLKSEIYIGNSYFNEEIISIIGEATYDADKRLIDTKVASKGVIIPTISTNFVVDMKENYLKFAIQSEPFEVSLSGHIEGSKSKGVVDLRGKYRYFSANKDVDALITYEEERIHHTTIYSGSINIENMNCNSAIDIEISNESFDSKFSGNYFNNTWNLENFVKFVKNDKVRELQVKHILQVPNLELDNMVIHHFLLNEKEFLVEKVTKIAGVNLESNINWVYGEKLTSYMKYVFLNHPLNSFSQKIEITKLSNESYVLKYSREYFGMKTRLEGTAETKITDTQTEGTIKGLYSFENGEFKEAYDFIWTANACDSKFQSEANFNLDGKSCFLIINVDKSDLKINSNILKPFSLNVNIGNEKQEKSFLITSKLDDNMFEASGKFTPNILEGNLRYKERAIKWFSKRNDTGIDVLVSFSPQQRFGFNADYALSNNDFSVNVGLETPFVGWEKEVISVTLKLGKNIQGQVSASWNNNHHMTITLNLSDESEYHKINYVGNIRLTSTVNNYENINISINHLFSKSSLSMMLDGKWNLKSLKGLLEVKKTQDGYKADLNLETPFTDYISGSFLHKKTAEDVLVSFDFTFRSIASKILLKGKMIDYTNLSGSLKCFSPYLPEIVINMQLFSDINTKNIEFEGKWNERKVMFSGNCNLISAEEREQCKGWVKLVADSNKILSVSLSKNIETDNKFEIDTEISSSLISGGSIKGHFEGQISSLRFATLNGKISGPNVNSKIKFSHQILENYVKTKFSGDWNTFNVNFALFGDLNRQTKEALLHGEITSNNLHLKGIKFDLEHSNKDDTRETLIIIKTPQYTYKILHSLNVKNYENWTNFLQINDIYSMKNILSRSEQNVKFETNISCPTKQINLDIKKLLGTSLNIEASLNSPWTSFIRLTLNHEKEGDIRKSRIKLENLTKNILELNSEYEFNKNHIYLNTSLFINDLPLMPISLKIKADVATKKSTDVNFQMSKLLNVNIQFNKNDESCKLSAAIKFDNSKELVSSLITYSSLYNSKAAYIECIFGKKKYAADFRIDGDYESGILSSNISVPYLFKEKLTIKITYTFNDIINISMTNTVGQYICITEAHLEKNNFVARFSHPDGKGSLSSNWILDNSEKLFVLNFESPFDIVNDTYIKINSEKEKQNKRISFDLRYGSTEISVLGIVDGNKYNIDFNTNVQNYEKLRLKLDFTDSLLEVIASKGDDTIKISGDYTLNTSSGEGHISWSLPILGYQSNSIIAKYRFKGIILEVTGNANIGAKILKFDANADLNIDKKVMFDVESNIDSLEKIFLQSTLEKSSLKLNGVINKNNFNSELTYKIKNSKNIDIILSLTSSLAKWKSFSIESHISLKESPYKADITIQQNQDIQNYSFECKINKNTFEVEILSPIEYFQHIKILGSYNYEHQKFESELTAFKNNENYKITGYANFQNNIPDIKINIIGPTAKQNIEFIVNGSLNEKKSLNISLQLGNDLYSFITYIKTTKIGEIFLQTSVPQSTIDNWILKISFDLKNEDKYLLVENENGGIMNRFLINGKIVSNEFILNLETPIESYKKLEISGQFNKYGVDYLFNGKIVNNDSVYNFDGKVSKHEDGYILNASIPTSNINTLNINFEILEGRITLNYIKDYVEQQIIVNYFIKRNTIFFKLQTPFDYISYVELNINVELSNNVISTVMHMQKNSDKYEMEVLIKATPLKSNIIIDLNIPSASIKYAIRLYYDVNSVKKDGGIIFENGSVTNKIEIEFLFDDNKHGFLKLQNSFFSQGIYGIEYNFDSTSISNTNVYITLFNDINKYTLGMKSIFDRNGINIELYTPFKNFEMLGIECVFKSELREGKLIIVCGKYNLLMNASIRFDKFEINMETPFDGFKVFKISLSHGWNYIEKYLSAKFVFNTVKFELSGILHSSKANREIAFKIVSPFKIMQLIDFSAKINTYSAEEFIKGYLTVNSNTYSLLYGYQLENSKGMLKVEITSPFRQLLDVQFYGQFDLDDKKFLDINFINNGVSRPLQLSGKFINGEVDFDIKSPFETFGNFKARGSYNRAKRSLDLQMMNDHHHGGIVASFNSFKMTAKTPYKKAQNVYLEISKKANGWTVDYKRNNNKIFFNLDVETKKKVMVVKINSELPGWELLALAGRIDIEEALLYVKGQKNSNIVKITGNGRLRQKTGALSIKSSSSLDKYKEVTTKIEYNAMRNIFKIDSRSSSSDYKIIFEIKKGLYIDVFVPNDLKNTVAKGRLTPFKGNLSASSRFLFLKSFSLDYGIVLGPKITSNLELERNGLKIIQLEFEKDNEANTAHLMIHGRRKENHSMLHFHREGWNKLEFSFKRNGKEFKVDINGSGNLPQKGQLDFEINNSFREVPRTITGKLTVDRLSQPKELNLEVNKKDGISYTANLKYNANLTNKKKGDFVFKLMRKTRDSSPYDNISGNWDIEDAQKASINLKIGSKEYKATGKLGMFESDLVFHSNLFDGKKFLIQWKFSKTKYKRDHFLKIGREDRFVMIKLQGTIKDKFNGDINGALRISRFMKNDLEFTGKWSRSEKGLTGSGTFTLGEYSGTHKLINLKRDPNERAAKIHWEATSNIEKVNNIKLIGEYNIANRMIDMKLSWDTDEIYVKGSLNNFTYLQSENVMKFHIPKIGDGSITLSHDFTNPLSKSVTAVGTIGSNTIEYKINWTRNEEFTKFDLNAHIKSGLLGDATLKADYNIINFSDAKGSFIYKRNDNKFVNLEWSRVKNNYNLKDELTFSSHFKTLPTVRIFLEANWKNGFTMDGGIQYDGKSIESKLNIGPSKTTASLTTPFQNFEDIHVSSEYDLKTKDSKVVSFNYKRGEKIVKANIELKRTSIEKGSLLLTLISPFDVLKNLNVDAKWDKGKFEASYKRNDITVKIEGTAEVKTGNSSFDVGFTMPSGKKIHLQFSYDLMDFIKGTGSTPKVILHNMLHIEDESLELKIEGYRTSEKVYMEVNGNKSFGKINTFYMKLDSELNLNKREGRFELKANEFTLNAKNTFEKLTDGYYLRSQIKSTLTNLPGLTIGLGRDGDSFILTTGFGDEREITITLKGKDHFKRGFYGSIDIPRRKIIGLEYNVDYDFPSDDELKIDLKIQVKEGKYIEANIHYNSDGVKSRLSTPWTGSHSARFKRSSTNNYFMADIGFDNYGIIFESDDSDKNIKKGFRIEGNLLGGKILLTGDLDIKNAANADGSFLIETPFKGLNKFEGLFKIISSDKHFIGEVNVNMFYKVLLQVDLNLDNNIKGNSMFKFNDYLYEMIVDFQQNKSGELHGNILIKSPHISFERIVINGVLNGIDSRKLQASLSFEHSLVIYRVDAQINLNSPTYLLDFNVKSSNGLNCQILADYSIVNNQFYLSGQFSLHTNGNVLVESRSRVSMENKNISVLCEIDLGNSWKTVLNLTSKMGIKGELKVLFMNQNRLLINFDIPDHLKNGAFDVIYQCQQNGKMSMKYTKSLNSIEVNFNADFLKYLNAKIEFQVRKGNDTFLNGKLIAGQNKFAYLTENILNNTEKLITRKIEVNIPLWKINFDSDFGNTEIGYNSKISVNYDANHLSFHWYNFDNCSKFGLGLKIGRATIEEYKFDVDNRVSKYSAQLRTHVLPGGPVSLEGNLDLNAANIYDMNFIISTPYNGYENLNFGMKYSDDVIQRVAIYANPFNLKADCYFGTSSSVFSSGIELQTGLKLNESIKGAIIFPLETFEPSFSASIDGYDYEIRAKSNKTMYGREIELLSKNLKIPMDISMSYRTKAPYEFNLNLKGELSQKVNKFGIIFDSSFLFSNKYIFYDPLIISL